LISNRSEADTRFLLVQGVGPYDFLKSAADLCLDYQPVKTLGEIAIDINS